MYIFVRNNRINLVTKFEGVIIFILVVLFGVILWILLPLKDITTFNIISLISTVISFIGFYIAIKQITSVREITEKIDVAVKTKLTDFNKILLLSDVSSKISLIHEIKAHLRKEQLEVCIIRMEDLKKIMATIIPNAAYLSLDIDEKILTQILKSFNMDMNTIEKKMLNNTYQIETGKIISNMDKMSTYLLSLEAKLKQN